jgi:hypothetical protein
MKQAMRSYYCERGSDPTGFVYVIESGRYYKIGSTKNPKNRFRKYITENPNKIEVVIQKEAYSYIDAEKLLHELFNEKRCHGEWFLLNEEDLVLIKERLRAYEV